MLTFLPQLLCACEVARSIVCGADVDHWMHALFSRQSALVASSPSLLLAKLMCLPVPVLARSTSTSAFAYRVHLDLEN